MSSGYEMCTLSAETTEKMKKFRIKKVKQNAALVLKLDIPTMSFVVSEEIEDFDLEEMAADLPEREPRFIALICKDIKEDNRITYPLMCIFVCPDGCKTEHNLMYTASVGLITNAGKFGKIFKVRETEEITDEWLKEKLSFFK